MRKLEDFSIKEYEQYEELTKDIDNFNIFEVFELFGIKNAENMEMSKFKNLTDKVINTTVLPGQLKETYTINGKKYHLVTQIKDIKAAQFIDYQIYLQKFRLHEVLSIFLLPIDTKITKILKRKVDRVKKYNDGYDILEIQKDIHEHLSIKDAFTITNFFLSLSQQLLPIIHNSLMLEKIMKKIKLERKRKKLKLD